MSDVRHFRSNGRRPFLSPDSTRFRAGYSGQCRCCINRGYQLTTDHSGGDTGSPHQQRHADPGFVWSCLRFNDAVLAHHLAVVGGEHDDGVVELTAARSAPAIFSTPRSTAVSVSSRCWYDSCNDAFTPTADSAATSAAVVIRMVGIRHLTLCKNPRGRGRLRSCDTWTVTRSARFSQGPPTTSPHQYRRRESRGADSRRV